jgi:hypothetical protein
LLINLLQDFHEEYAVEAFRRYDQTGSGFITAVDFQDIMMNIKSHLLTDEVKANLVAAASGGQAGKRVSFPYFMAFNSLLNNMELIKRIYLNATNGTRNQEVTKGMLNAAVSCQFLFCHCTPCSRINASVTLTGCCNSVCTWRCFC